MQSPGLVAHAAKKTASQHRGSQFIFSDRILCSATNWRELILDWWDALAVGGHLILWLPDCRYQDLSEREARVTLDDIMQTFASKSNAPGGWQLREADFIDGYIYVVLQKRDDAACIKKPWVKRSKHLLISRTGAHGDALMASSILPWLKNQGWSIDFITKPAGLEVLRHEPNIDALIRHAEGQVSFGEMPYYWQSWAKRYDRFINLVCSVEGELLKQPGRPDYFWSDEQRRAICARSYLGYLHKLANVPGPYRTCFYPDEAEKAWAGQEAAKGPFVLWCLRGRALHKWWPYGPQAICSLLSKTNLRIILSGDEESKPLAASIMNAARIYRGDMCRILDLTGKQSIRSMMTIAHHASAVVGPETGILNAVSMQPVPKVLLLSHSAPTNLSDDWIQVTALQPSVNCYPCHRIHFSSEWCPQDEKTGAAVCGASISIESVVDAVIAASLKPKTQPWWLRDRP